MKVGCDDKEEYLPLLDEFLENRNYFRPLRMNETADAVALLLPHLPIKEVRKVISTYYYVLHYCVYYKKQAVMLPYIGTFFARFKNRAKRRGWSPETKSKIDTVTRAKWAFKFKSKLMDRDTYKRFIDVHKASAEKYGFQHDELRSTVYTSWIARWTVKHPEYDARSIDDEIRAKYWRPYRNLLRNTMISDTRSEEVITEEVWQEMVKQGLD